MNRLIPSSHKRKRRRGLVSSGEALFRRVGRLGGFVKHRCRYPLSYNYYTATLLLAKRICTISIVNRLWPPVSLPSPVASEGLVLSQRGPCFHSWYRWSFDPIHPNLSSSKCSIAKQFVREEWYMDRGIVGEGQSDAVAEPPRPFSLLKTLTEFRVSCRVFYVGFVAREGHLLWFIRIPSSGLCSAAIFARFGSGYWSQCFACIVRCLYR